MPVDSAHSSLTSQRLRGLFRFAPGARRTLVVGGVVLGLALVSVLCLLLAGGPPGDSPWRGFVVVVGGLVLILTPLAVFILLLAAVLEKRAPPRALLWVALAIITGAAGTFFALLSAFDLGDAVPGLVFLLAIMGPIFLLFSLPAVYFTVKTLPELRAVLQNSQEERVLGLVQAHGKLSMAELAADAGLGQAELARILDELLAAGRLAGMLNQRHRLVFTSAYLDAQQRLMLDLVRSGGRLRLERLAAMLAVPGDVLNDWLYQAIQRGQFTGYINWKEGRIYSVSAAKIGSRSQCPNCGGQLAPGGGETVLCVQCGSQIVI